MSNFYESFFKTEKWNKIWNASNENEFKIEGRNIKQIREEINFQRNQLCCADKVDNSKRVQLIPLIFLLIFLNFILK